MGVKRKNYQRYRQWVQNEDVYLGCGRTVAALEPGFFDVLCSDTGIFFRKATVTADELLVFPDSLVDKVLREIETFWNKHEVFTAHKLLHRMGYMFWGPPGSGKSCLVYLIIFKIINMGGVVLRCNDLSAFAEGLKILRAIEPQRPLVCIYEDIDSIIRSYGDDNLLQILDGAHQVDRIVNIATTNYPEKLDPRVIRSRRFDRIHFIGMPNANQREMYFKSKLLPVDLERVPLQAWVARTEGMTFASMTDLIARVCCLECDFEESAERVALLQREKLSSEQYAYLQGTKGKTGFARCADEDGGEPVQVDRKHNARLIESDEEETAACEESYWPLEDLEEEEE